jgi:hypothetical protein
MALRQMLALAPVRRCDYGYIREYYDAVADKGRA